MNPIRWRGWLIAAVIFVLGVVVGGASVTWLGARAVRRSLQGGPGAPAGLAERAAVRIGADLRKNLQLTPDEAQRVQAILDESAANLRTMRREALRNARAELRSSMRRIAAELPPEKRAQFREIMVRRFERLGLRTPAGPEAQEPE
ncbi:hypothetical protein [Opitutus terrae]|uniref:Periplasmic heavy metal sensor n=1 Tax=Opitutus terrae (strain DSM 11246 / JCM 15787 / PB90-1) TaxID=452637 RepID=B1ZQI0_OPITP|nr:hypothetical protein [Opitutus terrae]ACB75589.1 hypothetical protein Oter_2307 [Opitutus terrae PB90-1]